MRPQRETKENTAFRDAYCLRASLVLAKSFKMKWRLQGFFSPSLISNSEAKYESSV